MENTNKLPEDFKAKWVAALRSGEYKQCTGSLCRTNELTGFNEYCCLGVAYRVFKGVDPINTQSGYIDGCKIDKDGLPQLLIGTGHKDSGAGYSHRLILTRMNDIEKSFSEISDYIEANL